MKFFEPSDFSTIEELLAKIINEKLQREAKVVYGRMDTKQFLIRDEAGGILSHKALLINIEEIKDQQRETTEQEKKDILAIAEKIKKLYGNSMIGSGHLIKEIREYWMSKANTCDPPAEKVYPISTISGNMTILEYKCQCDVIVKPNSFVEIK